MIKDEVFKELKNIYGSGIYSPTTEDKAIDLTLNAVREEITRLREYIYSDEGSDKENILIDEAEGWVLRNLLKTLNGEMKS